MCPSRSVIDLRIKFSRENMVQLHPSVLGHFTPVVSYPARLLLQSNVSGGDILHQGDTYSEQLVLGGQVTLEYCPAPL